MASGLDSSAEIQTPNPTNSPDNDVFRVADLYAKGQAAVNAVEGQPIPKGREVLFPITSNDGIPGGDQRIFGMQFSTNFDSSKPTRLIVAAHGVIAGDNAANSVMATELDPEGHAESNTVGDNVVYMFPIGKNETVPALYGQYGTTSQQDWRTPGANLLPTKEGQTYQNDLIYWHDSIAAAEKQVQAMGSSVYMKQGFGFSDGGRMVREYNNAYPGEFSYVESDHGTSLGNDKSYTAQVPTTIVESGPSSEFPAPGGGTVDGGGLPTAGSIVTIGDRMLPPEGGPGDVSATFATPDFLRSQPMRQIDEALAANYCVGDPKITFGNGHDGHEKNAVETTWENCAGGYVKLVQEYLDPQHKWASPHAVNDVHYGAGGMWVIGDRVDNNEVSAFWRRSDEIARQKLPASEAKPAAPENAPVQHG